MYTGAGQIGKRDGRNQVSYSQRAVTGKQGRKPKVNPVVQG